MKLVNLKEFLTLPENTLFARYREHIGELEVLTGVYGGDCIDFVSKPLNTQPLCSGSDEWYDRIDDLENGIDVQMDFDWTGRNGMFNETAKFVIFSQAEVQSMIMEMLKSIKVAYKSEV